MKIIFIGSPGSGKSYWSKKLNKLLNYPILHLDRIYHTGGKSHISRNELIKKVEEFTSAKTSWIIDGNYISTIERRIQMADTIILFNIPTDICINNIYKRANERKESTSAGDNIAEEFDESLTMEFIEFVENFKDKTYPKIESILSNQHDKNIFIINDYNEINSCINCIVYLHQSSINAK